MFEYADCSDGSVSLLTDIDDCSDGGGCQVYCFNREGAKRQCYCRPGYLLQEEIKCEGAIHILLYTCTMAEDCCVI